CRVEPWQRAEHAQEGLLGQVANGGRASPWHQHSAEQREHRPFVATHEGLLVRAAALLRAANDAGVELACRRRSSRHRRLRLARGSRHGHRPHTRLLGAPPRLVPASCKRAQLRGLTRAAAIPIAREPVPWYRYCMAQDSNGSAGAAGAIQAACRNIELMLGDSPAYRKVEDGLYCIKQG